MTTPAENGHTPRKIYRCNECSLEMILSLDGTLPFHQPQAKDTYPKIPCGSIGTKNYAETKRTDSRR